MKALVYTDTEQVTYRDEPAPAPRAGDVVLDVVTSGICGSDMHAYHGHDARRVPPLILGHEVCATVADGERAGRRVVVNPLMSCLRCADCLGGRSNLCRSRELIGMRLPGAMAERVAVREGNLLDIPPDLDPVAAALTEPAATALHAVALVERVAYRPLSEARCLVVGGGAIGVLVALVLKAKAARGVELAETNALRRRHLGEGIDAFDPLAEPAPHAEDYDAVFDCVGTNATRALASAAVRPGGILSHVGLQSAGDGFDSRRITLQEITVLGNYCYTPADLAAAIDLLHRGRLGELAWVDVRPLSAGAGAFADLHHGRVAAAKIVLRPDPS